MARIKKNRKKKKEKNKKNLKVKGVGGEGWLREKGERRTDIIGQEREYEGRGEGAQVDGRRAGGIKKEGRGKCRQGGDHLQTPPPPTTYHFHSPTSSFPIRI